MPALPSLEGGCLCGAIRFRLLAPPYQVGLCHCVACRRHTGAPVAAFADCRRAEVIWTRGERRTYSSSPGVTRGFCPTCGSTLTYESDQEPDDIHMHIGALDTPEAYPPTVEASSPERRLPWLACLASERGC